MEVLKLHRRLLFATWRQKILRTTRKSRGAPSEYKDVAGTMKAEVSAEIVVRATMRNMVLEDLCTRARGRRGRSALLSLMLAGQVVPRTARCACFRRTPRNEGESRASPLAPGGAALPPGELWLVV